MLDVVSIGTLAVDYVALVPKIVEPEGKVGAIDYQIHLGGVAGNTLTQLALLGAKVGWFGKLGDDPSGELLIRDFKDHNIDTNGIILEKGKNSMFTWIQVDEQGDRAIVMFPNTIVDLTMEEIEIRFKEYIKDVKIFSSEATLIPLNIILKAAKIAVESGARFVFDIDVDPLSLSVSGLGEEVELRELISLSYATIPSKATAKTLTGKEDPYEIVKALLDLGPEIAGITLGDEGCILGNRDEIVKIPAYPVEVRDTTGAGDAFHGAFIYGLLQGWDLHKIGKFANATASLVCTRLGARSIFRKKEIEEFTKKFDQ